MLPNRRDRDALGQTLMDSPAKGGRATDRCTFLFVQHSRVFQWIFCGFLMKIGFCPFFFFVHSSSLMLCVLFHLRKELLLLLLPEIINNWTSHWHPKIISTMLMGFPVVLFYFLQKMLPGCVDDKKYVFVMKMGKIKKLRWIYACLSFIS